MVSYSHLKLVLTLSTLTGAVIGGFGWQYATQAAFGYPGDAAMIMGILSGVMVGISVGLIAGGLIDVVFWGRLENRIEDDQRQPQFKAAEQPFSLKSVTSDSETTLSEPVRKAS